MKKCRSCDNFTKSVGVGKCMRFNKFRSDHCSCIAQTKRFILTANKVAYSNI
ncbi:MAG TPA: hypothetical protein QF753_03600 [Victivallales bacterium]|nr:hypothetical protein [Victivallales bacterium]